MPRDVDAWMDGVALSTLGAILIQQVHEDPAQLEIITGERPGRYGERLISTRRQSLRVAIEAAIQERFDLAARSSIQEQLAAWAHGSILELSNHPGRRLLVSCSAEPALGEVRDYTTNLRMEFTAHAVPFWEDSQPSSIVVSGSSGSGTLLIPGTEHAPVCLSVKPTGAALTSFTATVAGQQIALAGLNVAKNGVLSFARDSRDDLIILYNGASQLSKRSAASADDFLPSPGNAAVSFTANTACTVTFSARGRWA